MKVSIRRKGLVLYLLLVAASLAFSSFYAGPFSFAWLYAILLLIPLSAFYIFMNCRFLRVYQEMEVHKVVRGEDHMYRAKIENAGILPIHGMKLHTLDNRCNLYEIRNGQQLSPGIHEKTELTSGISCKYAGAYEIGIDQVSFTDPFSIFTVKLDIPYSFRAIVNPPVTDLAASVLDLENLINHTGLTSSRRVEDTPGSDLRPYQRGDSLNSINWKVSARLSTWMSRVPDRMENRTVTILMLASNVPKAEQNIEFLQKRDYFLEFAVSAAWHFGRQGVPVRMIYPAGNVTESTVDSYESFMDFYSIAADGIFYHSDLEWEKLTALANEQRSGLHDSGTWILIREDPEPGESHCEICP